MTKNGEKRYIFDLTNTKIDQSTMLSELKTLIAVSQYGTFSGAGARIGLTQSAVSAQMQRLETELGFALFDRTGRSATLNDAGRETLALAEEMMTLYNRLSERGAGGAESGMLRVGAIASAQVSFLADALARFRDDRPGWRIRVVPGVSLGLLGQVDSGELDLAVIIKPPFALPSELEWRTLVTEPFVLLAPKALARGKRRPGASCSGANRSSATTAGRSAAGWSTVSTARAAERARRDRTGRVAGYRATGCARYRRGADSEYGGIGQVARQCHCARTRRRDVSP
jgi:Transcriptional regulator